MEKKLLAEEKKQKNKTRLTMKNEEGVKKFSTTSTKK